MFCSKNYRLQVQWIELQNMFFARSNIFAIFLQIFFFQAIVGGCACFWGSILGMGVTYMLVVLLKRSFEPQEIVKEED